jgi:Membrane domain of glycerophosphoryl diester phosphodiesterase
MDTPETIAADYLRRGAIVDIGSAISRGWALVRDNAGVLIGASALGWLITIALGCLPIIGWILGFVLLGGLYLVFIRRVRGEAVQVGDVFAGFTLAFANLALAGLVTWLLTTLGFLLCILPGIYLVVGYVFVLPLVIDKKMDFWPAMEVSRQVVHRHWWSVFGLLIVLGLIVVAGFLVCIVGAVVAIPVATASLMYVYEDLFGANVSLPSAEPATHG